jgi:hypothetical protein
MLWRSARDVRFSGYGQYYGIAASVCAEGLNEFGSLQVDRGELGPTFSHNCLGRSGMMPQ